MADPIDPLRTGARARRLLGHIGTTESVRPRAAPRALEAGRALEARRGGPSQMRRGGLPGADDKSEIVAHLRAASNDRTLSAKEAGGIAAKVIASASEAVSALAGGTSVRDLPMLPRVSLEAVLHTRGRPAVRLLGDDLEDLSIYPGAEIWEAIADMHRRAILDVCASTGALRVRDVYAPDHPWVQGTAWLVAPDLAITNRHVLFPPMGGTALARRVPGTTTARLKADFGVTLDFAFDNGAPVRQIVYAVTDVPFVAERDDPVDAALLKVRPLGTTVLKPLTVSGAAVSEVDRLYVVGHPGKLDDIPADVRTVFGDPDERKRVSFGTNMDEDAADASVLIHDASTIGGYSGGCILGFLDTSVRALHYFGDYSNGNRAIAATALRAHPVLGPMLS